MARPARSAAAPTTLMGRRGNGAAFTLRKADGEHAVGLVALAFLTYNRRICVLHRTQGIKFMSTIFANILINRHNKITSWM